MKKPYYIKDAVKAFQLSDEFEKSLDPSSSPTVAKFIDSKAVLDRKYAHTRDTGWAAFHSLVKPGNLVLIYREGKFGTRRWEYNIVRFKRKAGLCTGLTTGMRKRPRW